MVTLGAATRLAVTTREFDRALVRLGARIGEEHSSPTTESRIQPCRKTWLQIVVIQVRNVQQGSRLIRDGVGNCRVCVTERYDGEAAEEVEVFTACGVVELRPLSPDECHGKARIGSHDVRIVEGL